MESSARSFDELVQAMRCYQESRLLMTSLELNVYTAVGNGATAPEVAARIQTDPRATGKLLNALVAIEVLSKQGDLFRNTTETGRYLVDGSPDCQRAGLMHSVNLWPTWSTLTDCVRKGSTLTTPRSSSDIDLEWTRNFIDAMQRNSGGVAKLLAQTVDASGVRRFLDVGGGSAVYTVAFARANPNLQADVFDLPHVVPITEEYIAKTGLSDRVKTRAGDMRTDDLGSGYDMALLSSICHMFGEEENRKLVARCRRALNDGGRLVIRDFILNEDHCSPRQSAMFALNMLVGTKEGSTYTQSEYTSWFLEAGFRTVDRPIPNGDFLVGTL